MKKVIGGIALILSLAGLGYSGFTIYGAVKGVLEKRSLNKEITELKDKKVKTEASLKDITEKNNNSYYDSELYIIKNNHYLANIKYNKENPDAKRFLETLYIPEQN